MNRPIKENSWAEELFSNSFFYIVLAVFLITLMMLPFISALMISFVLLLARMQIRKKLQTTTKSRRRFFKWGTFFFAVLFLLIIVSSFKNIALTITSFANNGNLKTKFAASLDPLKVRIVDFLEQFFSASQATQFVNEKLSDAITRGAQFLAAETINLISSLPDFFLFLAFAIIVYLLLKRHYHDIRFKSLVYLPQGHLREKLKTLWRLCELSAYSALISTLSVALVQGLIVSLGAMASGVEEWPLYFLGAFIFSFFPVVGLLPIIILGAIHTYTAFGLGACLTFSLIGVASTLADNILRTLLMSKESDNINSFLSFFCLIGAIYMFGLSGLILGPFFIALASNLLKEADSINISKYSAALEAIPDDLPAKKPKNKILEELGYFDSPHKHQESD